MGEGDIILLKTPGKFFEPQLIKRACQTPKLRPCVLHFYLESGNKILSG